VLFARIAELIDERHRGDANRRSIENERLRVARLLRYACARRRACDDPRSAQLRALRAQAVAKTINTTRPTHLDIHQPAILPEAPVPVNSALSVQFHLAASRSQG